MSCERPTDHWYTASLAELASDPHLAACPTCQRRLDMLIATDDALRTHVGVGPSLVVPPRSWSRARTAWIGLAAAAVLAVAVWNARPRGAGPEPARSASMVATDPLWQDFLEVNVDPALSSEDQLAELPGVLREKVDALEALRASLEAPCTSDDPTTRGPCLQRLGDAASAMGLWLRETPRPPLNEEQLALYDQQLAAKARVQEEQARAAYAASLDAGEAVDEAWWTEEVHSELDDLELLLEEEQAAIEALERAQEEAAERALALVPVITDRVEELRAEALRCAGTPEGDEATMVVDQAAAILEAEDPSMLASIASMVDGYLDAMPLCP